ncbi:hypothetical protein ACMGGR_11495 [Erwinia sp. BNK-24-b]|uniref:hypothetical protein n=1 Tax=Erwinia TaxID=551 RepID=UPI001FEFCB8A|nr:hypothetical protein [Erwinia phyllosphaerae]MBV4366496.1 hypothetical protein [Erwinia phyllosphaerae]
MEKIIISALLLTSFAASADYSECEIVNGQIFICGLPAQSESVPVKQSDDYYYDCSIISGSVFSCKSWAQAENVPVLQSDGYYSSCSIVNGGVSFCASVYQGKAILFRD